MRRNAAKGARSPGLGAQARRREEADVGCTGNPRGRGYRSISRDHAERFKNRLLAPARFHTSCGLDNLAKVIGPRSSRSGASREPRRDDASSSKPRRGPAGDGPSPPPGTLGSSRHQASLGPQLRRPRNDRLGADASGEDTIDVAAVRIDGVALDTKDGASRTVQWADHAVASRPGAPASAAAVVFFADLTRVA